VGSLRKLADQKQMFEVMHHFAPFLAMLAMLVAATQ
jgi:hypothetical protein